jgi:serine/threonine protein kinase
MYEQRAVYNRVELGPGDVVRDCPLDAAVAWDPASKRIHAAGLDHTPPPLEGVVIAAQDSSKAYRIRRYIGKGAYGVVYSAQVLNPKTLQPAEPSVWVAIKFQPIQHDEMAHARREGGRVWVPHPGKFVDAFLHYSTQAVYRGCMPTAVCIYDVILYVRPETVDPGSPLSWYVAVVMEHMHKAVDAITDIKSDAGFAQKPYEERFLFLYNIFLKMCRAVIDLELQQVFQNDIKPENFLVSDSAATLVKINDYDLGCMASRTGSAMNNQLRQFYVLQMTEGRVDIAAIPWLIGSSRHPDMLSCKTTTTDWYAPPEYSYVGELLSLGPKENFKTVAQNTIGNGTWMSRMMAFQLAVMFRHMCLLADLDAGFDRKHLPHTGGGVWGISKDLLSSVDPARWRADFLVEFDENVRDMFKDLLRFERRAFTKDVPQNSGAVSQIAKIDEGLWKSRSNMTVSYWCVPGHKNYDPRLVATTKEPTIPPHPMAGPLEQLGKQFSRILRLIIAPYSLPRSATGHTHMDYNPKRYVCVSDDMYDKSQSAYRPTVPELLTALITAYNKCGSNNSLPPLRASSNVWPTSL